jgi:hypothetical protein
MIQKVKDKQWIDESGSLVPLEYVSPGYRLKERHAAKLIKEAKRINEMLASFKKDTAKLCNEVYEKMMEEFKVKAESKGNFTWYNFDRSIRIEVSINDRIDFDDLAIAACKQTLDEFLSENLDSKQEFVKDLVTDAFSTSRGKLDAKKVMNLLKYRTKIKASLFQEALNLLESSIRKPESKTYFRISERNDDGSYTYIDLNFSSL